MSTTTPETVWYENLEQGTFHEVVKGTDSERRMRSDRYLEDVDDENSWTATYQLVDPKVAARNPERQPGYVAPGEAPKTPEQLAEEQAAEVNRLVEQALAARDLQQKQPGQQAAAAPAGK